MAVQDPDQVTPAAASRQAVPAALTVAQAKANLLQLGEEVETERGGQSSIMGLVRNVTLWAPLVAALVGVVAGRKGAARRAKGRGDAQREGRAAGRGITLELLFRILRPLVPLVFRYLALQRRARAASGEDRPRARAAPAR